MRKSKYVIKCGRRVVSRHRMKSRALQMLKRKAKRSRKGCRVITGAAKISKHTRRKYRNRHAKRGHYKRRRAYKVEVAKDFLFPQSAAMAGYRRRKRRK